MDKIKAFKDYLLAIHPCREESLDFLFKASGLKKYKKGTHLVMPGQIQHEMYFVSSGIQMSYFETDSSRHVIAFTYHPNLCAIPESFGLQSASPYFLQCLSDSELYNLSFHHWEESMIKYPDLERLFRKLAEILLTGMISRHIQRLTLPMEERFIQFCRRSGHLLHAVPHKYLASYLDIEPTNFSKLYNQVKI